MAAELLDPSIDQAPDQGPDQAPDHAGGNGTPFVAISPARRATVLVMLSLVLLSLVGKVAYLQTTFADARAESADRQHRRTNTLQERRGSIFDRHGLMLVGSVETTSVYADPKFLHDQFKGNTYELDVALERLADELKMDRSQVALAVGSEPWKRYVPLARGLSDAQVENLKSVASELGIRGLGFEPEPRRVYPMGSMAAHVLGAVGRGEIGLEGIERVQDELLTGEPGQMRTRVDKKRRTIASPDSGFTPPRHGTHLVLTIDTQLQRMLEEELARQCQDFHAESGSAVLLDPHTGDVLAMAIYPAYFPQYLNDSTEAARRNRLLVDPYEPGSVVKPFLVAAYLEEGLARIDEVLDTNNPYRNSYGRKITDFFSYAKLSVWDVVVKSSNIGMVKLGERTTDEHVRDTLKRFGFGERTGLELPGESGGQLPTTFTKYSRDSMSFGYEMLATPMQMARAMSSVASDGYLVRPHLIAGYVDGSGQFASDRPETIREQVLKPETARTMRRILADGVTRGSSHDAASERWNLFGKTGTAHRAVNGGYDEKNYIASFVGGAPFEDPRLVIAVSIVGPDKEVGHTGGKAAAPLAGRILENALEYLNVPESPDDLPLPPREMWDKLYNWKAPKDAQ